MSDDQDFSNYPTTLGERRHGDSYSWSPRDLLISLLRRIDSKEIDPKSMIIVYELPDPVPGDPDSTTVNAETARTRFIQSLGMLAAASKGFSDGMPEE